MHSSKLFVGKSTDTKPPLAVAMEGTFFLETDTKKLFILHGIEWQPFEDYLEINVPGPTGPTGPNIWTGSPISPTALGSTGQIAYNATGFFVYDSNNLIWLQASLTGTWV